MDYYDQLIEEGYTEAAQAMMDLANQAAEAVATQAWGGVEAIRRERQHQIRKHDYDFEHDRQHTEGQLVDAAIAYIYYDGFYWPWEAESFRPEGQIPNLIKAGALLAAEIDRLRAESEDD
jgi:hypothetical protein